MRISALMLAWLVGCLVVGCNRAPSVENTAGSQDGSEEAAAIDLPVHDGPALTSDAAPMAAASDWPWWGGPRGDGKSTDQGSLPTSWTTTENVLWKAPVVGRGHSSPSIVGERIFMTTADEQAEKQLILCYDRQSGGPLWSTVAHEGGFMEKHDKNSEASATPACAGERVYAAFINGGDLKVTATDLDGNIVWQESAGVFDSEWGYGSSILLHESLVIVLGDSLSKSFIAALDRETGELVWSTPRKSTGKHGSWATPVVGRLAGKDQLLVTGTWQVTSYNPTTGELIWFCEGPAECTACTVAISDELVFASGGYPEKEILAIRADGSGDVTDSHVVWRTKKDVTYVPSPVYHDGHLYTVNDGGVATCIDAASGKQLWQKRLGGAFSASPVLAGGHFYATNESGRTFVFKAGPKFEAVAENDLGDGGFASPVICGGRIFIRTDDFLYCIGTDS